MLNKLIEEFRKLNSIIEKLFKERFSSSKHEDRWSDELFKDYETVKIRIELLIEMIE